jgi:TolB-like protein
LGVSALVSGRVVPRGDSIEVGAELTDVRDNTEIWGQHYSGKSADIDATAHGAIRKRSTAPPRDQSVFDVGV